jgi:TM2 domain-containing membrane protein YozV
MTDTPPPPPPPSPDVPGVGAPPSTDSKKLVCGITGILVGAFGVHKFILGYTKEALIMLLVTVLTCGIGGIVMGVIGLVEGIIYLTKSDDDFVQTYQVGHKGWF